VNSTRTGVVKAAFALTLACSTAMWGQTAPQKDTAKLIGHGKYLVEDIGQCGDCHTPFTDKGEPDQSRAMQGAVLGFRPLQPVPNWAAASVRIAGLPGWSDADGVKFFTTGIDPKGKKARPPMPQVRYNKEDAAAVTAYLKSLK
jgi:mono/diheme cytochrome c family protein